MAILQNVEWTFPVGLDHPQALAKFRPEDPLSPQSQGGFDRIAVRGLGLLGTNREKGLGLPGGLEWGGSEASDTQYLPRRKANEKF